MSRIILVSDDEDEEVIVVVPTGKRRRHPFPLYKIACHRRSFLAGTCLGISSREYRKMRRWKFPKDWFVLLLYSHVEFGWVPQDIDIQEWMSGMEQIVKVGKERGHKSAGFEIGADEILQDFLGNQGFMHAVKAGKRLRPRGLQHWDTVCTSWVWVCKDGSKRSLLLPMGDVNKGWVVKGNAMVSRMILVGGLGYSKLCELLLEQPGSSLMDKHDRFDKPPFNNLLHVRTMMGAFGAPTCKPSKIFGTSLDQIYPLKRSLSKSRKAELSTSAPETCYEFIQGGRVRCTGNKHALKQTQVYPREYAETVVKSWEAWKAESTQEGDDPSDSSESDYPEKRPASWPEAGLRPVIAAYQAKHGILRGDF